MKKLVSRILNLVKISPVTTGTIFAVVLIFTISSWKPYFINRFFSDSNLACANLLTKELSWKKPRNLLYYGSGIYSEKENELVVYRCINDFGHVPKWEYGREIMKQNEEGWERDDLPEEDGSIVPGTPLIF